MQIVYTILYKEFEHLQILVSEGGAVLEPIPHVYLGMTVIHISHNSSSEVCNSVNFSIVMIV